MSMCEQMHAVMDREHHASYRELSALEFLADELDSLRAAADEREKRIVRLEGQLALLQQMHSGHEPAAYHHSDTGA